MIFSIKNIVLAIIFSLMLLQTSAGWNPFQSNNGSIPYCNTTNGNDCGYSAGVEQTKNVLTDIEKSKTFSEYVQLIVKFFLTFVAILAVLYIIFAGFRILTSNGNDETVKKSKNTILYVAIGIIVIWLAYPIVKWILDLINI